MKLYLLLDGLADDENPVTIADKFQAAASSWLESEELEITLVDRRPDDVEKWQVGLQFNCKRKAELKAPLEFLFPWAKKEEREFVVGLYDKKRGGREDVCYFGFEEGKPDINEVAMYLGL